MSKDKISDYSATANSNTDIGGINIDEGCAPSGINDAIRTLMKQIKDWQSGSQDVYIHPAGSASAPSVTATGDTNTGLFFPAADTIALTTGGTERLRLDSSGNLGLGVTPSAWASAYKVLDVGNTASFYFDSSGSVVSNNSFINSSFSYRYKTSNAATRYEQTSSGQHQWFNAASGTAGNAISFTQAMTLDASGNLMLGTTTQAGRVAIKQATTDWFNGIRVFNSSSNTWTGVGNTGSLAVVSSSYDSSGSYLPLAFYTSDTERARIDSSGNLLVGTTGTVYSGKIGVSFNGNGGAGSQGIALIDTNASLSGDYALFVNSSGNVAGRITHNGTTTVAYTTSSDYRLKENIAPMTGALAKVAALKPVTYSWKDDKTSSEGFIAHELAEVCPHAVVGEKDAVDADGNPVYQGIDTSFLVATLTAAIQELKAIVDAQAAEIAALKG